MRASVVGASALRVVGMTVVGLSVVVVGAGCTEWSIVAVGVVVGVVGANRAGESSVKVACICTLLCELPGGASTAVLLTTGLDCTTEGQDAKDEFDESG